MVLYVDDRRILKVLLGSQGGLESVRMLGKQHGVDSLHCLFLVLGQAHILFLIDSLQLGMEAPDHRMPEPVGLDLGPIVDLVGRDVLGIDRHIVGSEGVSSAGADYRHQFVVFVRDGDLGSLVADRVYLVVEGYPFGRVGLGPVNFEQGPDGIEERFLSLVVGGSETLAALEHKVLEIVGETGGLVRVVLAADLHGDVGLQARCFLVDGHIYLQSVVKGVDLCLQRIPLDGLVLVLVAGCQGDHCQCG